MFTDNATDKCAIPPPRVHICVSHSRQLVERIGCVRLRLLDVRVHEYYLEWSGSAMHHHQWRSYEFLPLNDKLGRWESHADSNVDPDTPR